MYWYKTLKQYISFTGLSLLLCCGYACKPEIKETGAELKYFDIKEYFKTQADKLQAQNPLVNKSVKHNGTTESKRLSIGNWERELSSFTESDINKPAWKSSYSIDSSANTVTYKAKLPELKTREVVISKKDGKVAGIVIVNDTKNLLYNTSERLSYYPDSCYIINKTQTVKVIGANSYEIKGKF